MTVTFGFYNSLAGDRRYNARQVSSLFDGIIRDGVFMSVGNALAVSPGTGMNIIVDTGRAWFNRTWTDNDAALILAIDPADALLKRIDVVVLEVDESEGVRANSIKIVKGTLASNPVAPTLINNTLVHQYPLAHISVPNGTSGFTPSLITNKIGTAECPYVTGVLSTITIDNIISQWESEFNLWFDEMKDQLTTDAAGNLQTQINNRPKTNLLSNPDFSISQRLSDGVVIDADVVTPSYYYWVADRWRIGRDSWGVDPNNFTYVRGSISPDEGFVNTIRFTRRVDDTIIRPIRVCQEFRVSESLQMVGDKLTFSAYIKLGAGVTGALSLRILGGTVGDERYAPYAGHTLTGLTVLAEEVIVPDLTNLYVLTTPDVVPSTIKQIAVEINYTPQGTGVNDEYIEIHGLKLEKGSEFTGWNFPNYSDNLKDCYLYFERRMASAIGKIFANGITITANYLEGLMQLRPKNPVPMHYRVSANNAFEFKAHDGTTISINSLVSYEETTDMVRIRGNGNAYTIGKHGYITSKVAGAYIDFIYDFV